MEMEGKERQSEKLYSLAISSTYCPPSPTLLHHCDRNLSRSTQTVLQNALSQYLDDAAFQHRVAVKTLYRPVALEDCINSDELKPALVRTWYRGCRDGRQLRQAGSGLCQPGTVALHVSRGVCANGMVWVKLRAEKQEDEGEDECVWGEL